jgi:ParB-like chromosome segregation protein Spo0J
MKDFTPSIVLLHPDQLKPYPSNSKIHSQEQILEIALQIERNGFDQPIVVEPDYTIIKGHGRWLASKYLDLKEVPVIVQNLTQEQAKAARIADNKVAEAPWDEQMLKDELRSLEAMQFDMKMTGFDEDEYRALLADAQAEMDYSPLLAKTDEKIEAMTRGVRKALMIDFAPGDYEEAFLLAKFFRDRGAYLGGMLMQLLREEKAKLPAPDAAL